MTNPKKVFLLFLLLNVLNYLDRNITTGIATLIQADFHMSDLMYGWLGTAFMITYSLTGLPFGMWSDRWKPHKVAAIGAVIWSLCTMLSAISWSYASLFVFRSLVGIGEAAFVVTGSVILSGLFDQSKRAKILGFFNLGLPIGSALGVTLGGVLGGQWGWQWAFVIAGLPGLVVAYYTWNLTIDNKSTSYERPKIKFAETLQLFKNIPYLLATLGYAGISFAFGALAFFGSPLLQRMFGYSVEAAGTISGAMIVVAGLTGAPLGGYIADYWHKRSPHGRIYTVAIAMILSAACLAIGVSTVNLYFLFGSIFFMLWHVGVASAIVFDVTKKYIWNTAQALSMLLMHLLGDIPSNPTIGYISDRTNLVHAISYLSLPMVLAAIFFFAIIFFKKKEAVSQPRPNETYYEANR